MPTGHMMVICWHEEGGDPEGKERYQQKQKAKQMAKRLETFHIYDKLKSLPVKFVMGNIHISIDAGGQTATIILDQCLHVPDAPINLISVGTLTKNDMTGYSSKETMKHIVSGKARVTGVTWNGKAPYEFCPSCILGKCQQSSYDHNANCATKTLELLHIDICSLMPLWENQIDEKVKKNDKVEHFIRTLKDDIQTYLANSGLPMSF
ncbi:hypothetical protein EDD85DRAFT_788488 [Armillaria nabsnona]|nr:hypothetical protein EDD85DRAFT_788488 [Armillaria nabsnona]